jgi:TRAP-type transport system small permease protein
MARFDFIAGQAQWLTSQTIKITYDVVNASEDLSAAGGLEESGEQLHGWGVRAVSRLAFAIGSIGIAGAALADFLGVAGRHIGLPLLGSIELVQASVVLLAAAGMLVVTFEGGHARVHFVNERVGPALARKLEWLAALLGALFFVLLVAGSAWILVDLWQGHERTELLGIPLRWFRLIWIAFAVLIAGAFLHGAMRKPRP